MSTSRKEIKKIKWAAKEAERLTQILDEWERVNQRFCIEKPVSTYAIPHSREKYAYKGGEGNVL